MEKLEVIRPHDAPENGFYRHCKRTDDMPEGEYIYQVLGIGHHTETGEKFVIYRPLYESPVFLAGRMFDVRPLHDLKNGDGFMDPKITEDGPIERFTRITDKSEIVRLIYISEQLYKCR